MEPNQEPKWEGKARAKVRSATADQVWPFLEDFSSLHKWLPSIDTCRIVDGVAGQPGCVRYCAGTSVPSDGGGETVSWANEKLLSIDPIGRTLSYEVIDNNVGFGWYVGTFKVSTESDGGEGCTIEWSFIADPMQGWSLEGLVTYVEESLKAIAQRMEDALQTSV
ncbi:lachrymatory-factor synthase [Magnolia sinica]|uniref:lachrymatory-factor synthase n=1 Tax=Magnolia sinica TaxID=86752 RepID=UPI0026589705|nr:lachrymatory-factor synthase [Magnolia sinica]